MSTKIYYAWRVPINKLNETFDFVRSQIYKNGEEILKRLMTNVQEKVIKEYRKKYGNENYPDLEIRFETALQDVKEASKSLSRNSVMDPDFVFNIWLNGDYAYLVPIGEYTKFKMPEWAEDYSYWDNVDEPEGLKEGEFEARGDKWEEINCGEGIHSHNARRMVHSIIDLSMKLGDFDFEYEMRRILVKL